MRIISGRLGGRTLKAPPGRNTRPTSDRVREAVFNILGDPPQQTAVLDAFAGAGTLGLEALSRGAGRVCFIEQASPAVRCLHDNIHRLQVADHCRIYRHDSVTLVRHWQRATPPERFRWVFVDPPYRSSLASQLLQLLAHGTLLTEDAVVIVEHDRHICPDRHYDSLQCTDRRKYGDTLVSFFQLVDPNPQMDAQSSGT